ncbi:deazaflavin-dependent oxidoreductase (nitroreductase family) [Thermosporothrix hazakensis]|jgi:deazaflavin-dependent oxidoreductase (nitroreductase family)|uniref:Deazaflavin-dependent oxidoreductase (Nitroreductase family) n=2 Tax=Thermosporothrix hazakensis TaxID=644383 RepID=A0A326UB17_THEHA|nr:deazaflavin-dependent oxidoreductase (nitroreductase family) [Thermosporothrix hazakensis]GCE50144.1 hypothetical protein KTH_50130 [Thermosporothrix hazakensis]
MYVFMSDLGSTNHEIIQEFRQNKGKVGGYYEGQPLLLLHTKGRKSGQKRITPLAYTQDGERIILIGANVGSSKNPDWYYNILAHPEVTVEIGEEHLPAIATMLEGAERERFIADSPQAWAEAKAHYPDLPDWPIKRQQSIPVIALTLQCPSSSASLS